MCAAVLVSMTATACVEDDESGGDGGDGDGDGGGAAMGVGGDDGGCDNGPLDAPIPGCMPTPVPDSGNFHRDCVDRINQFRWDCQCLPPLERWKDAEDCSDSQSKKDQSESAAHGNFGQCNESAQNTCPNWPSTDNVVSGCLQAMWDEGPGEPFSEHGHYINMSNQAYTKVACGKSESDGGVWSNQNFSR